MPSSPITQEITLPDNWVHLQKTMIPDQATGCYWSVWYDVDHKESEWRDNWKGTAWLMWCPFGDDPSLNDNWGHVEDLDKDHTNILDTIKAVFGISFHESVWKEISPAQTLKDNPIV